MLLDISGIDYTNKIIEGSYEVNNEEIYTGWTDANLVTHRYVSRNKWSGSFDMYFGRESEFDRFIKALKDAKHDEGGYNIGIQCNNTNEFKYKVMYVKFTPTRRQRVLSEAWFPKVTVKVEER